MGPGGRRAPRGDDAAPRSPRVPATTTCGRSPRVCWAGRPTAPSIRPTVVVFHHPPAGLGLPGVEPISLVNAEAYAAVIARHGHVVATLAMPGEPGEHAVVDAPPVVAFHLVEDERIVTHWRALPG